jgi:hypothetical protein
LNFLMELGFLNGREKLRDMMFFAQWRINDRPCGHIIAVANDCHLPFFCFGQIHLLFAETRW